MPAATMKRRHAIREGPPQNEANPNRGPAASEAKLRLQGGPAIHKRLSVKPVVGWKIVTCRVVRPGTEGSGAREGLKVSLNIGRGAGGEKAGGRVGKGANHNVAGWLGVDQLGGSPAAGETRV